MPGYNSELWPLISGQSDTAVQQSQSPFYEQFKSATEAASQSQDVPDTETNVSNETEPLRYPARQRRPSSQFKDFVDSRGRH